MIEIMKALDTAYAELELIRVSGADVERMYHAKRVLSQAYQIAKAAEKPEVTEENG